MESVDAEVIMLEFVEHQSVAPDANMPEWEQFCRWIEAKHPELYSVPGLWALLWATAQEDGPKMNLLVHQVVYRESPAG